MKHILTLTHDEYCLLLFAVAMAMNAAKTREDFEVMLALDQKLRQAYRME
jgi:hypothetical protein